MASSTLLFTNTEKPSQKSHKLASKHIHSVKCKVDIAMENRDREVVILKWWKNSEGTYCTGPCTVHHTTRVHNRNTQANLMISQA
jgi:hypothetical protein